MEVWLAWAYRRLRVHTPLALMLVVICDSQQVRKSRWFLIARMCFVLGIQVRKSRWFLIARRPDVFCPCYSVELLGITLKLSWYSPPINIRIGFVALSGVRSLSGYR